MKVDRIGVTKGGFIGVFKIVEKLVTKIYQNNSVLHASCPKCGTVARFSRSVPLNKSCRVCGTKVFGDHTPNLKPKKGKHFMYYVKFSDSGVDYYKIGHTKQHIYARFRGEFHDPSALTIIKVWEYDSKHDAMIAESTILSIFANFKVPNGAKLLKDGNTEVFYKDVLGLDK